MKVDFQLITEKFKERSVVVQELFVIMLCMSVAHKILLTMIENWGIADNALRSIKEPQQYRKDEVSPTERMKLEMKNKE